MAGSAASGPPALWRAAARGPANGSLTESPSAAPATLSAGSLATSTSVGFGLPDGLASHHNEAHLPVRTSATRRDDRNPPPLKAEALPFDSSDYWLSFNDDEGAEASLGSKLYPTGGEVAQPGEGYDCLPASKWPSLLCDGSVA